MNSAHLFPVFDGHNDTLTYLFRSPERSFLQENSQGHIDLPRARKGGFMGGFFAIFPRSTSQQGQKPGTSPTGERSFPALDTQQAHQFTLSVMAYLFRLEKEAEGQIKVVRTGEELAWCLQNDILATVLHFEGAEAIDPNLDALEVFYQAGLRSLGLVWSRPNIFAQGVPFTFPHSPDTGPGLTDAGRELVRACNQLRIMLDLSHLNEKGFWDVARLSDAPLVATHSNVFAICPSPRNLTDKQLDAIKASEGIVGLNFALSFLREDGRNDPTTPLDIMVRHIDYLVERMGIDHVGFGSDFDGGITPSQDIVDVTGLPRLISALRDHGYDNAALRKLTHENWLRVLRKTWQS